MSIPLPDTHNMQIIEPPKYYFDAYVLIEVRAVNHNSGVEYRKYRLLELSCYVDAGVLRYDKDSVANQLAIHKAYTDLFNEATYKTCSTPNFKGTYRIITKPETILDFANPDRDKEVD